MGSRRCHLSCRASLIVARHLHAPPAPASSEHLSRWMGAFLDPTLRALFSHGSLSPGGLVWVPSPVGAGPRVASSPHAARRQVCDSPPPSGADHFKSRWCLKRVIRKKNPYKSSRVETRWEEAGMLWEPRGQQAAGEPCRLLRAHPRLPRAPGTSRRREVKAHVPLRAQAASPAARGPCAGQDHLPGANRGRSCEIGDLHPI